MLALTREISDNLPQCQLTHLDRLPIDVARARRQHAIYEQALRDLGCQLVQLPADPACPDGVFIEDTAVVLDEIAIVTRPGAPSRQSETEAVAAALAQYRPVARLSGPATLDGGDVLQLGRTLFVGASRRSNAAGIVQLGELVAPHGYHVQAVEMGACLHLKTAVTQVAPDRLLLNPNWVDPAIFGWARWLAVAEDEPMAANALWLEGTVVYPRAYEKTARILQDAGLRLRRVEADELAKAEGGVSCCSLILR